MFLLDKWSQKKIQSLQQGGMMIINSSFFILYITLLYDKNNNNFITYNSKTIKVYIKK